MAHLNNDKYLPALLTYKNNGEYSNLTLGILFFCGPFPASFSLFCLFNTQLTVNKCLIFIFFC